MARSRKRRPPQKKQEAPIAFRAGPELSKLVSEFASMHRLNTNEAFKKLAALAISNLDVRYYAILSPLAASMGGSHSFVRAVSVVREALEAAALADPTIAGEPKRTKFIIDFVQDHISSAGLLLSPDLGRQLMASLGVHLAPLPSAEPVAAEVHPKLKGGRRRSISGRYYVDPATGELVSSDVVSKQKDESDSSGRNCEP